MVNYESNLVINNNLFQNNEVDAYCIDPTVMAGANNTNPGTIDGFITSDGCGDVPFAVTQVDSSIDASGLEAAYNAIVAEHEQDKADRAAWRSQEP